MRRTIYALVTLLIASSLIGSAAGQAFPIAVSLGTGPFLPIGQTTTVTVTVRNIVNSTVQLVFVGLQFEWTKSNIYFTGGNSDKGAVLAAAEQIAYTIAVQVPDNVSQGPHKLNTLVSYRWFKNGNWTGTLSGLWVGDVQVAFPQAQGQTATGQGGLLQTFSLQTIAVLVAVVGIGLFLERGRVRRLLKKFGKTPEKPESEKPPAEKKEEKEEEDL